MAQTLVLLPETELRCLIAPLYDAPSGMHACDSRVLVPLAAYAHDWEFGSLAMCTSETMQNLKVTQIHEAIAQEA
jgi:hypothetical protein